MRSYSMRVKCTRDSLQEKRNFLRNPPAGVQFSFDYSAAYPVALTVLQEDANLQQMRFELVPKQ